MDVRCFQQVHADLIEVSNRPNDVGPDMTLVIERLEAAIDSDVGVLLQERFASLGRRVAIDPLLYFDQASAVVEFVGYVCCLGGDGTDLANEGDLRDVMSQRTEEKDTDKVPESFHGRPI